MNPPSLLDPCQRGHDPSFTADGAVLIPLADGSRAIVDLDDYDLVRDRKWAGNLHSGVHRLGTLKSLKSTILGLPRGTHRILHVDGDTHNCRRSNLRAIHQEARGGRPSSKLAPRRSFTVVFGGVDYNLIKRHAVACSSLPTTWLQRLLSCNFDDQQLGDDRRALVDRHAIMIRLDVDRFHQIEEKAKENGVSVSSFIRRIVFSWIG